MHKFCLLGLLTLTGCGSMGDDTRTISVNKESARLKITSREVIQVGNEDNEIVDIYLDKITHKEFICVYHSGCIESGRKLDNNGVEIK